MHASAGLSQQEEQRSNVWMGEQRYGGPATGSGHYADMFYQRLLQTTLSYRTTVTLGL